MFKIALKNVILNWRLSFAALTSVITAFMCLALFQGYIRGVDQVYHLAFENRFMYGDLIIDIPVEFFVKQGHTILLKYSVCQKYSPPLKKYFVKFFYDLFYKKL